eukprot:gene25485-46528_t
MAAGRAVVASRIGDIDGLIRHGETGLLCAAGDRDALAQALGELIRSPHSRSRLGSAARHHALNELGWDSVARVLKRRHPPARFGELRTGLSRVYRHVAPYLRAQRRLAFGAGMALIGATALRLIEPWPLKLVIDRVVASTPAASSGIAALDALPSMTLLFLCAGLVLLSVGLRALCEYLATVGFALTGSRVLGQLRHDLYCHLQRLSLAFHETTRTGDLTMRVVNDVSSMREAMVTAMLPFATNVLILVSMAAVMLVLDWRLALVAPAPLPLLPSATVPLGRRTHQV